MATKRKKSSKRRGRGFGHADADHATLAKEALRQAKQDIDRLPPTCVGAIKLGARAVDNLAKASAHFWSMNERKSVSKLMGERNILEKKLYATLDKVAFKCGNTKNWTRDDD